MAIKKNRKIQERAANLDGDERFDRHPHQWLDREDFLHRLDLRYKTDDQVQKFLGNVLGAKR